MQIFIPVTLLSHPSNHIRKSQYSSICPQSSIPKNTFTSLKNIQSTSQYYQQTIKCHSMDNIQHFILASQPFSQGTQQQKRFNLLKQQNNKQKSQPHHFHKNNNHKLSELQKKSTKSSLNDSKISKFSAESNQKSSSQIILQNRIGAKRSQHSVEPNLQTQGDILPQIIYSCKICLQSSNEPIYDAINNPICKVCNCKDYVHLKCLQEWISRRVIVNQQIHPDQCQICLSFYQIEVQINSFFSFQILLKNFKSQPYAFFCKFIPAFGFLTLSIFGLYLLIYLILQSHSEGGLIKQILSMPYGTCLTIVIFLLFILLLVCGIFIYTWVTEFSIDFEYKLRIINGQKNQGNKMKTLN